MSEEGFGPGAMSLRQEGWVQIPGPWWYRKDLSHGLLHPKGENIGIWSSGSLKVQEAVVWSLNPEGEGD